MGGHAKVWSVGEDCRVARHNAGRAQLGSCGLQEPERQALQGQGAGGRGLACRAEPPAPRLCARGVVVEGLQKSVEVARRRLQGTAVMRRARSQ